MSVVPGARRERMHRRIEPPAFVVEAERAGDLELELLLQRDRELTLRLLELVRLRRDLPDERRLVLLDVVEEPAHLGRLHVALEVVEHDVVRLVADVEAFDVALAQVEVRAQDRQEAGEVVVLARVDPDLVGEGTRACDVGAQLGWAHGAPCPSRARRRGSGSPRTSRTRAARRSHGARRAAARPPREVNFSCAIRPTVASCSARSGPPPRGIITCWSQASSDIVLPRSLTSCSRRCSSSNDARLTGENRISGSDVRHGGPGGEARGRSPPPFEPRSERWRRTGSESTAGRARNPPSLEYAVVRAVALEQLQIGSR